ncbi:protein HOMOLOG OF MAMMALIAN LYST-INTERACTING PROTEIN 5-like [Cucurbita pepo subsp. pepo]|uniref:protein HOMOLOG OF MAMMALIAN LYST-INTERACTING PROTEIN 5-like n=1 Tax=Cucurbita pepo subsp. pepo TaxID=3664 RepID=UPI000C9D4583|nr:protein HOMOLOG OF MAMMALIAN LYST-INTERACTING PROTEIN 5-like [Cucurbita pepo subsp. pepo]
MASETEPAKLLLPYLQRADELQKHEPLVAYYCRLYAMERGLRIPQGERTKTTNALLVSLMNQLEKDKKSLSLGPDDSLHLEGFALSVFAKADKQDHAGRADLNTAKTFYAASIFFEIISQFGPLQPDLEQKRKYAVWKAADIRKALKEGRKPQPGPPSGDEDLSVPSSTPTSANDARPGEPQVSRTRSQLDSLPQVYDKVNDDHSNVPQSPQVYDNMNNHTSLNTSPPARFHNDVDNQHPSNIPSYPAAGYPSHEFHLPPPRNEPDSSSYSQPYHHIQSYSEHQQPLPHNYVSNETSPNYSYSHFQSYPSFSETSLPTAPSHHPTYYQGSDASYSSHVTPPASYPSASQYHSNGREGTASEPQPTAAPAKSYHYDSNYQPPPEKIAEAHKAARFAVGALAFDDVSVAVEHLKKSLELLTNPSAGL